MRLESIQIKNFKGLREAIVEPDTFACLVGENNAGKSTVLQAVVSSLNRPASLPLGVYYDEALPIEFTLTFAGITEPHLARLVEEHRQRVIPLLDGDRLTLLVRFPQSDRTELRAVRLLPSDGRLHSEGLDGIFRGLRTPAAVREAFQREFPDWLEHLPDGANLTQAKAVVTEMAAGLPREQLEERDVPLPSGIPGSIALLLPEPIYIPAVKNLNDDIKTTQSTSFGRLLGLLVEELQPDLEEFSEALRNLDRMLNRIRDGDEERDERHEKVQALEAEVERHLSEHFSESRVRLVIPPPELRTVFNSAEIWVDDGTLDLIENKGDGIRRSLTFALLRAYVHRLETRRLEPEADTAPRPLIFLFEEPELFLHPKSQVLLFRMLEVISGEHQVIVTTHSPLFFSPGVTARFIRVAKNPAEPKPIGVLHKVNVRLDTPSAPIFRLTQFENAESAFFSAKVVLFEGESDDFFLKHVASQLKPEWDFDRQNTALVRVSGKGNFRTFRDFFEQFGIEVLVVADLDALFDGFGHLGATEEATLLRAELLQDLDRRVAELGLQPRQYGRRIKKKVQAPGWRDRYERLRELLAELDETGELPDDYAEVTAALFGWEQIDQRLQAVRADREALEIMLPLLTMLREEGICVLSRGEIEDYYPEGVENRGGKPAYALAACDTVMDRQAALGLSSPFVDDGATELEEVFARIFG